MSFSRNEAVCSREKTPSEKRIKSGFAINSAKRSIASLRNGLRMRRDVSSVILVGAVRVNRRYLIAVAVRSYHNIQFGVDFRFVIGMPTDDEEYARPARPPDASSLNEMREAASECTACHLYKRATQTVCGEGPKSAPIMLVGEQPGDYEDVAGKPFVGPAGKIMDQALEEAGINRSDVYVTNAVKHFKWEPRGKRRIHKKPNSREIAACRPWLEAELRLVKPTLLVVLGSTAGQAIFGPSFRVTRERGKVLSSKFAPKVLATVHPSSLLRQPDEESRQREYKRFVLDLRAAVRAAREE